MEPITGGISITVSDTSNVGYYFDIINEHSITLQSQITDNYLENNTAVQDHIAKSPIIINLSGISGELVYTPPTNFLNKIKEKIDNFAPWSAKLGPIPQLIPSVDNYTQAARDAAALIETNIEQVKKVFKLFKNKEEKKKRLRTIYDNLIDIRDNDISLTAQTPFGVFDNMYIQSATLRQGNENYTGDIELTLKQVNYAVVRITEADSNVMDKYNSYARAQEVNCGKAQGVQVNNSILYGMIPNAPSYKVYGD